MSEQTEYAFSVPLPVRFMQVRASALAPPEWLFAWSIWLGCKANIEAMDEVFNMMEERGKAGE